MPHNLFRTVAFLFAFTAFSTLVEARQQPVQAPSAVQSLCALLCGGTWHAKLSPAQAANLRVSYVYEMDSLGTVVVGKGYFTPTKGKPWVDTHFYMADPGTLKLRYMGISPKTGMTSGTVKLTPRGFTSIVNQLNVAQLFARIVNDFSVPGRHVMTIYQSEDGFEKPSAIVELARK